MKYDNCQLYKLKSKKMLKYFLGISDNRFLKQEYVSSLIHPYIEKNGKPRLIEPPDTELKIIQKRLKTLLGGIEVPDNVFSGIKNRSYADNAKLHIGQRNLYKIDFTAFFPSIKRETVYSFFREDLKCSPDVADILTNLTTVDLARTNSTKLDDVYDFLRTKKIQCQNHLISGAPTSQIMSYLVNHQMFDEMQRCADQCSATMSVYVDDVTFSSKNRLSNAFRRSILGIVQKYNYQVSRKKVKGYSKTYPKLITGVIIDANGNATLKNALRKKLVDEYKYLQSHPNDVYHYKRLRGLLSAARQIDKNAYPHIYQFACDYKSSSHEL